LKYEELLNIVSPEEVKFKFEGKLGRIYFSWREGTWIITNKRLIFISDYIFFEADPFPSHFQRPLALIILLREIKAVLKKETKIIVKYLPTIRRYHSRGLKELGIGFYKKDFQYENGRTHSHLLNAVYNFLSNPIDDTFQLCCPNCNAPLPKGVVTCPTCSFSFRNCQLCKFQIIDFKELTQCPYCQSYFHKAEILEWIKIHTRCPICEFKITPKEIWAIQKNADTFSTSFIF